MKKDFGKKIWELMARCGIKTARELADRINDEAHEKIVSAGSVGKWLAGRTVPKSTSLMFLAKALNVSADLILFDEGENPEQTKSLERMVSSIVKAEIEKSSIEKIDKFGSIAYRFLESKNIPQEVKNGILRQITDLLKLYPDKE